ncbi:MAG TPA: carboxypeptidase regulatory-like domain-containing protein [Verrucomicrobiota bacterium]|nr:carboxypeptidase regulatory-like domain-containing protein [Verrucomicrobiota bacterium]
MRSPAWHRVTVASQRRSGQTGGVLCRDVIAFVGALLCAGLLANAEAVIEGRVVLPKPVTKPVLPPRYENVPPAMIGRPEPPVAVVYLEGAPTPASRVASTNEVMRQHHLQFERGLLPVQVGTEVEFPNEDNLYHNVFSYSKAKRFDLGRYARGEKPPAQHFTQPGVVRLNCEIHPHMRATILVLETPFFTRTDTNGFFRLSGLPAGRYTVKAWIEEKDIRSQLVELSDGAAVTVDFSQP